MHYLENLIKQETFVYIKSSFSRNYYGRRSITISAYTNILFLNSPPALRKTISVCLSQLSLFSFCLFSPVFLLLCAVYGQFVLISSFFFFIDYDNDCDNNTIQNRGDILTSYLSISYLNCQIKIKCDGIYQFVSRLVFFQVISIFLPDLGSNCIVVRVFITKKSRLVTNLIAAITG